MTEIQLMVLSVCLGAVVDTLIAELFAAIKFVVKNHKKKKRKHTDAENKQS